MTSPAFLEDLGAKVASDVLNHYDSNRHMPVTTALEEARSDETSSYDTVNLTSAELNSPFFWSGLHNEVTRRLREERGEK